jgi:hypothetical protein
MGFKPTRRDLLPLLRHPTRLVRERAISATRELSA